MPLPGDTSGTYDFEMSNAQILSEAFDRIQIRGPALTRAHLISARQSLQLELQRWSNLGTNLWKIDSGTINLVAGTGTYVLPQQLELLTDLWFRSVNGASATDDTDRIMLPITRSQYAAIPTKGMTGQPSQYWYQRLPTSQITIWPVPQQGAPDYVLNWFGMLRIQDAGIGSGETPNIVYRAYDALCAALAYRLAIKYASAEMQAARKAERDEAWADFTYNDQESGSALVSPNLSGYARVW